MTSAQTGRKSLPGPGTIRRGFGLYLRELGEYGTVTAAPASDPVTARTVQRPSSDTTSELGVALKRSALTVDVGT